MIFALLLVIIFLLFSFGPNVVGGKTANAILLIVTTKLELETLAFATATILEHQEQDYKS